MAVQSWNPYYLALNHGALIFAKTFGTLEVVGTENIPAGACVFASNHVSHLDPPLVGSCIPREIYYLARKTLFDIPLVGYAIERSNAIAVDLERGLDKTTFKKLKNVGAIGESLLIFPEGTRSVTGELQEPKGGTGMLACSMGLNVVPIRIYGAFDILPRGAIMPRGGARVTVVFGKAMRPVDYDPAVFDPGKKHPDRYLMASKRIMAEIAGLKEPPQSIA